ncbi:hypothetical protein [Litoreibacter halocynthiae]|uniref:hypothetical protein n=1 Tax=Litoreibacter halocynthiae TaxID=1242689 RepID=UPI00248F69A8|nr:hypothetical protein [Litoreibacter halocynthiae]
MVVFLITYAAFEESRAVSFEAIEKIISELPDAILFFAYAFLSFLTGEIFFFMGKDTISRPKTVRKKYCDLVRYFQNNSNRFLEPRFTQADEHADLLFALTYAAAFCGFTLASTHLVAGACFWALGVFILTVFLVFGLFTSANKAYDAVIADCTAVEMEKETSRSSSFDDTVNHLKEPEI